jgi:uncharacterized protein HemX
MRDELSDFLVKISQNSIRTSIINNQLAETLLPNQKLNKTEASSTADLSNSLSQPKERDINQTQASPTISSPILVSNTERQGLGELHSTYEILDLPKIKLQQQKPKSRTAKILVPVAILLLFAAGGVFYLVYNQQIKESAPSNQVVEQSPDANQTIDQTRKTPVYSVP